MWNYIICILCHPLVRPTRTFGQFPLKAKQVFKIVVAPLRRGLGPGKFYTTGNRVGSLSGTETVVPSKPLRFKSSGFGLFVDIVRRSSSMRFAKTVTTGNECHCLFIMHGHTAKG